MRASHGYLLISSMCLMGMMIALLGSFPLALEPARAIAQMENDRPPRMPGREQRPELPQTGAYLAGDNMKFTLERYHDYERLRFSGNDETYYLTIEPAALGGRVLKYDSGDVALQVAGWGGVTIYTREKPDGIPAERLNDVAAQAETGLAMPDAKTLAQRMSEEIQNRTGLTIGFRANWEALNQSDMTRTLATDAIRNATLAIERVATSRRIGQQLLAEFSVVRIVIAGDSSAAVGDKLLTIHIAPTRGLAGRPSSLAILKIIRDKL